MSELWSAVAAEWRKLVTLWTTPLLLALAGAISVGLAGLVGLSFNVNFDRLQGRFDPLFPTFYGLTLGQLPLVILAVLAVTGEYGSGTVTASLAAMPRRGRWSGGKVLALAGVVLATAVVTVLVTFAVGQVALGSHATSLGAPGVAEAVVGACLYLTLISLFAGGVAMVLRYTAAALGVLLPLLFLGSQGLGNVPGLKTVTQYLPDQAGQVIMHLTGPPDDPRFGRPYDGWEGLGIMSLWTVAALLAGQVVLRRRDI
jgi:ABC-type transport system involved in multi-copper enzyme maturation permease subunit